MSIALNIIKIAEEEMKKANANSIEQIHLSVGKLSGVVVESLKFALDVSKKNGPLLHTDIIIEEQAGKMKCINCGNEFEADDYYVICPKCHEFGHETISGKELFIKSISVT